MTMREFFADSGELSPLQLMLIDICLVSIAVLAVVIVIAMVV